LVVEDEFLIADLIEDILRRLGCEVVGPEASLEGAMRLARDEALDGAILDVTIRGGAVFPVAETLAARGVPFVLASGYGDRSLPEVHQGRPRLTKPFVAADVGRAVEVMCGLG
jgi:DNA-binding response OmpR family regulator